MYNIITIECIAVSGMLKRYILLINCLDNQFLKQFVISTVNNVRQFIGYNNVPIRIIQFIIFFFFKYNILKRISIRYKLATMLMDE